MARLIAAAVPLFVATTAVSARLKHKAAMDVGRVLAPLAGFGIGLGIARLTGDPAEYAAAIALALAAAFLLATEGGLAPIAFTVGLAIGLLDPPPVAAVIMIGVVVAVGSWFGALLKGTWEGVRGSSSSGWPGWRSPRSRSTCSSPRPPGRPAWPYPASPPTAAWAPGWTSTTPRRGRIPRRWWRR